MTTIISKQKHVLVRSQNCTKNKNMEFKPEPVIIGPFRFLKPYEYAFTCRAKGRWFDKLLVDAYAEEFKSLERKIIEERILTGKLTVNNSKVGLDYIVKQHDIITQTVIRTESPIYNKNIPIIGETDDFIAVFKPHSIPIHASGGYIYNSLVKQLDKHYFPVHRLDRVTAGIIVMSKNEKSAKQFADMIKEDKISKTYVARVIGAFPNEEIVVDAPIIETKETRGKRECGEGGKESKTIFKLIKTNGIESLVECKPITGRTHQIRAHLCHIGFPISNDEMYGGPFIGLTDEEEESLKIAKEMNLLAKEVEREWKENQLTFEIYLCSIHYKADGYFDFSIPLPEWADLDNYKPKRHKYSE